MGLGKRLVSLVLATLLAPDAPALEFSEIDSPAGSGSLAPRLTSLGERGAVLTWLQASEEGHRFSFARYENGQFGPARIIHEGKDYFANWADTPGLAVMTDGTWLAHWLARSGRGTYAYDVKAALSHDQGLQWTPPFSPHDDNTFTEHGFVSYFPAGQSGLGMAWLDGRETAPARVDGGVEAGHDGHANRGAMTLRSARVSRDGRVLDGALLDARVCDCCGTASALTEEGPVVVYRDRSDDEIRDIMLVRQGEVGWSAPVAVHEDRWQISACPVNGPAVLARGSTVIVAWFTMANEGTPQVRVARSGDAGRTFSAPVKLDVGTALGRVDLAWAGRGFALTWLAETVEGGILRLALFDANGTKTEAHDLVSLAAGRASGFPRLVALDTHHLLLAWTGLPAMDAAGVRVGTITIP